jgi:hypothetical protein
MSDDDLPSFLLGMQLIVKDQGQKILKYSCRFHKANTMLDLIRVSFMPVPLKVPV